MSTRTPKMERPFAAPPRGQRDTLSAETALRTSSLNPILATRSGGGRSTKDPNEPSHFSHVRYDQARSDRSITSRDIYDDEDDTASSIPVGNHHSRYPQNGRPVRGMAVAPDRTYPGPGKGPRDPYDRHGYIEDRDGYYYYRRRRMEDRNKNKKLVKTPVCYVFLKILEMLMVIAIAAMSRVFPDDISLDILHTVMGCCFFLIVAISLLVIWNRGHPAPDDCVHITVFVFYLVSVPVLLGGGILVLRLSDINWIVAGVAILYFVSAVVFSLDAAVMACSMLECEDCCCAPTLPPKVHQVRPAHSDHDDVYYRPHRYPEAAYRDFFHPDYPAAQRQMNRQMNGYATQPSSSPRMGVR